MKRSILALVGGVFICAVFVGAQEKKAVPSYRIDLSTKGRMPVGRMVYVLSCSDKHSFAAIYEDSQLTVPLANPMVPDIQGMVGFFLPVGQSVEGVTRGRDGKDKTLFECTNPAQSSHVPNVITKSTEATLQPNGDIIVTPKYCVGGAPPKNDADCIPAPISIAEGQSIFPVSGLQSHEMITKTGHYVYTIDDADNIYRCQVVSVVDPHNIFEEAPAFVIACYRQHEVDREK